MLAALFCLLIAIASTVLYFKQDKQVEQQTTHAVTAAPSPGNIAAQALVKVLVESDKNKDRNVTKAEFKGAKEVFQSIDTNRNGTMESAEIVAYIQALKSGAPLPPPQKTKAVPTKAPLKKTPVKSAPKQNP